MQPYFFDAYLVQQQVRKLRGSADRFYGLFLQELEEIQFEQKLRLRALRQTAPWDVEHVVVRRHQVDRANQVILRMRQYREMCRQIDALEARLPPRTGWNRLRYLNPWLVTFGITGLTMVINGLAILRDAGS